MLVIWSIFRTSPNSRIWSAKMVGQRVSDCCYFFLNFLDGLPAEMGINCELGAFGDDGKIDMYRTVHDRALDDSSINPRRQTLEKMISGMYLVSFFSLQRN